METHSLLHGFLIPRFPWFPYSWSHFPTISPTAEPHSWNLCLPLAASSQFYIKYAQGTWIGSWGLNFCKKKCTQTWLLWLQAVRSLLSLYLLGSQLVWSPAGAGRDNSSVLGRFGAGGVWRLSSDGNGLSGRNRQGNNFKWINLDEKNPRPGLRESRTWNNDVVEVQESLKAGEHHIH